jgi:hypothetical protein
VRLDGEDLDAAMFVTAEAWRNRVAANLPVPAWLCRLHGRLDAAVRVSRSRHDGEDVPRDSGELIGSREAAGLLGCSVRQLERLAADLDGVKVAGRWLFRRPTVAEYAEAKNDGRQPC